MAIPGNFQYTQRVVMAEVAITLVIFVVFQIIYYIKWGYGDQEAKPKQQKAAQQVSQGFIKKWDQKFWNAAFPIIFANHLIALALPLIYTTYNYTIVIAFIHFGLFVALLIVNIVVKDNSDGTIGMKTLISRILWALMCLMNIMLFIGGLSGVTYVITS